MKKLILAVILSCLFLPSQSGAADPHECGAAWEINVGLDNTFLKMTEEGLVESEELKAWAFSNGLPDVHGGTVHLGNIFFKKYDSNNPPANKEYVMLSIVFIENEDGRGKVKMRTSLSRLDPEGNYKAVMNNTITAPSVAALGASGMKAEIDKWTGTMQAILQSNLMPTEVTYTLNKHVIDAENPEEIEIKVTGFKDKHGEIADNGTQKIFCVDFEYREITNSSKLGTRTMKSLLADPLKFLKAKMGEMAEKGCIEDINHCSRPMGTFYPTLTKGFGAYWGKLLKFTDEAKEKVTIVCPFTITIPEPPVMVFMPGDRKHVSFRVTTMRDTPVGGMVLDPIKLTPSSFGSFSPIVDITDSNGFNPTLELRVRQNAQEGMTGELAIELCKNSKPEGWGKDESGNPIPWDLKAVQPVKISQMPMVNIDIKSIHKFEISTDLRQEGGNGNKREYRRNDVDETFTLTVEDARLNERTVRKDYTDDMGFKGTLVEYKGEAQATVSMSNPMGAKDIERHNGVTTSKECGSVPFDFEKHNIEHLFAVRKPAVKVVVYYRHYIPGPGSSVQKHPLEGLGMIQLNPADPAMTYMNKSTYRKLRWNGCSPNVATSNMPQIPVPMIVSNFFPINFWAYMDDCYGMEEVTVPLKEEDYMGATLREWDPETQKFDELHLSKQIDLKTTDSAECWDVSDRSDTEWHEPATTFVKGTFRYDHTADLVSGGFDLSAE